MKKAAFNPYLPFWETVPDGEICHAQLRNIKSLKGTHALYFKVKEGVIDFAEFHIK